MRTFWGVLTAYWVSSSWQEAWSLTSVIVVLTALSAKANVWFAITSGELINGIAYFHHPTTPTTLASLLTTAASLAGIAILKDAGFVAARHYFSTTLHRKWREWLNQRFNDALLDANHTHFHLQSSLTDTLGVPLGGPDNIDQRVQESIKGMTGGALGLAMGIAGVLLSLVFVGGKLLETSSTVHGMEAFGTYGSAVLAATAIAIYVPLNTLIALNLGSKLQHLSVIMQSAEGSYRAELNRLLHRSFNLAALDGERAQNRVNKRRYGAIDRAWAKMNRVTAVYMGFELVYNFIGSRIVAYAPGLLPFVQNKVSLEQYVTGAELINALINECSWFIHVMPDIAMLRANSRRVTDLAEAIENVKSQDEHYASSGPRKFCYGWHDRSLGLTVENLELVHSGASTAFLSASKLSFVPGEWTLIVGGSGVGKTSLIKAINRLWPHGVGQIMWPNDVRSLYAVQDVRLPPVPLKDLICLPDLGEEHSDMSVAAALSKAELGDFIEEMANEGRAGKTWEEVLSGGQKQKLVLAMILLHRPEIIFLDEPTSALDKRAAERFYRTIKAHCPSATVIAIMHHVSPVQKTSGVELFDSVALVENGVMKKIGINDWRRING